MFLLYTYNEMKLKPPRENKNRETALESRMINQTKRRIKNKKEN